MIVPVLTSDWQTEVEFHAAAPAFPGVMRNIHGLHEGSTDYTDEEDDGGEVGWVSP
jgi:hypothetical protein